MFENLLQRNLGEERMAASFALSLGALSLHESQIWCGAGLGGQV